MGKFDGILICTDCDGTLTDGEGRISAENARAIKYFQDNGGRFTLATGRFPRHALTFSDSVRVNAPIVGLNGVWLYDLDKEETISYTPMVSNRAYDVLEYINNNWKGVWEYWINYNGDESACYKPFEDKFESESLKTDIDFERICEKIHDKHDVGERKVFEYLKNNIDRDIAKIVFVMPEDMLPKMQADLKDKFGTEYNFDSSWPNGLEMQWIESSKGKAVEVLKKHLKNVTTVVCVGDYENDISMLKIADVSYAVSNATDEVKSVATRITVSNNDSALAHIIEELDTKR